MTASIPSSQTLLVVGGGIAGISAALEAAECGRDVVLIEREPSLGGRTVQMYRYFPKLCHPTCGLEINLRRLKANRRVRVLTMADVVSIKGERGAYVATINLRARHVNESCTACGDCAKVVEATIPDSHNHGLATVKAAYLPHPMAYPQRYVVDASIVGTIDGQRARDACKVGAIDLDETERSIDIAVGSVIWATGWKPYDAERIQPYGYGRFPNVVTSVEFERMADPAGPTGGQLIRPSDGQPARNIAFIQCAGSRDENHLRHCSRVCCMASLKHTRYVREAYGDEGRSTIYYIDIRAIDRFEDFYAQVQADPNVTFVKSKVANIIEDAKGNPVLRGVDTEGYHRYETPHDLVVLAVGMQPETHGIELPADLLCDSSGFIEGSTSGGQFSAGAASGPLDVNRSVQSATAAALRAIQVIHKAAAVEAGGGQK